MDNAVKEIKDFGKKINSAINDVVIFLEKLPPDTNTFENFYVIESYNGEKLIPEVVLEWDFSTIICFLGDGVYYCEKENVVAYGGENIAIEDHLLIKDPIPNELLDKLKSK